MEKIIGEESEIFLGLSM